MKFIQAHSENYKQNRTQPIKYIVIHYTANDGDTAIGNCSYFKSNATKSSAHYFVDENEVCQSVKEGDTAYHCGATSYKHNECRNSNSIGVELCSRYNGNLQQDKTNNTIDFKKYYFKQETVDNAISLTKELISKYDIPIDNIIRHYDVTGKTCPAPFANGNVFESEFKSKLFDKIETVEQALSILVNKGIVNKPEYWSEQTKNIKYLDELLIKCAKGLAK